MKEYLQKKLIKFVVKDVYNLITVDDILKIGKNTWEWRGRELEPEMVERLKEEAKTFSQSVLWKILKAELQWQASKTLLEKGETVIDIRSAQLLGYLTKVVDDKLQDMESERRRG